MLKNRTIIEFGVPGEKPSIVHHVAGNSLLIREIDENPSDIKVGEFVNDSDTTYTGTEFELSFKSPEAALHVLERITFITKKLLYERSVRDLQEKFLTK